MKKQVETDDIIYRKSFPVTSAMNPGTSILLSVNVNEDHPSRMVYDPIDLSHLGDPGNADENWYLANDIDLSTRPGVWVGPTGYAGTFDGNGHTIRNLILTNTGANYTSTQQSCNTSGLFSTLGGSAEISNFSLTVSTPTEPALQMQTNTYFGGVVGFIDGTTIGDIKIKNVTVSGQLTYGAMSVPYNGNRWFIVGGFLGQVQFQGNGSLTIENCVSNLTVVANIGDAIDNSNTDIRAAAGGLIGKLVSGNTTIKNSYATGDVTLTAGVNRTLYAGGLIGSVQNTIGGSVVPHFIIQNCYASGTVTVSYPSNTLDTRGGGLIGGDHWDLTNGATVLIKNCAALGGAVFANGGNGTRPASGDPFTIRGRIIGSTRANINNSTTLQNNIANAAMIVGASGASNQPVQNGTLTDKEGLGVSLDAHSAILNVLNADQNPDAWEYKSGASLPSLK
jgi:hypothetical protein